jgi:sugar lactone lactonase YvrE
VDRYVFRQPNNHILPFADGIALGARGRFLYWQALLGRTLYRIPTSALNDASMPHARLAGAVETVATTNVANGLWMDQQGYLYITDPEQNAVRMGAPDGSVYVTALHIQDMARFHEKGSTQQVSWEMFRIATPQPITGNCPSRP